LLGLGGERRGEDAGTARKKCPSVHYSMT